MEPIEDLVVSGRELFPNDGLGAPPGFCDCGARLTPFHAFGQCLVFGPIWRSIAEHVARELNRPNCLLEYIGE